MTTENRVWKYSTDQVEVTCISEEAGFSDLINDTPEIERAINRGSADVVRLVAEVRSKEGLLLGRASKDALEIVEHREPFDVMELDRSAVHDVVRCALAHAVEYLDPADPTFIADLRDLQEDISKLTMI